MTANQNNNITGRTINGNNTAFVPHSPNNPGSAFPFSPRGTFMPGFIPQPQVGYSAQNSNASISAISTQKAAYLTEMDSKNIINSRPPTPNSNRNTGVSIRPSSAASTNNASASNIFIEQRGRGRKRKKVFNV